MKPSKVSLVDHNKSQSSMIVRLFHRSFAVFAVLCCFQLALASPAERKVGSKQVLGKLGQAISATGIHASTNRRSRVFYQVKADEYLVVRTSSSPDWLKVLMQNGRLGYISAEKVARLPYDVTAQAPSVSRSGSSSRDAIAGYSLNYIGTPYKWGGNDIDHGIDCSGFVKALYGKIGIDLPRTAAQQALVGQPLSRLEDLQKGDRLYFWDKRRGKIGHTGMYLGDGFFVHASSSHRGVATDDLRSANWRRMLVAARR